MESFTCLNDNTHEAQTVWLSWTEKIFRYFIWINNRSAIWFGAFRRASTVWWLICKYVWNPNHTRRDYTWLKGISDPQANCNVASWLIYLHVILPRDAPTNSIEKKRTRCRPKKATSKASAACYSNRSCANHVHTSKVPNFYQRNLTKTYCSIPIKPQRT